MTRGRPERLASCKPAKPKARERRRHVPTVRLEHPNSRPMCRLVGWSTAEAYELTYAPLFRAGQIQPAVVWSAETLAATAIARIEERLARPDLPALHLRIPARLRLGGNA